MAVNITFGVLKLGFFFKIRGNFPSWGKFEDVLKPPVKSILSSTLRV